jgi:hypothetical protein
MMCEKHADEVRYRAVSVPMSLLLRLLANDPNRLHELSGIKSKKRSAKAVRKE